MDRDPQRPLWVERLGRVAYAPMLARQEERHTQVLAGEHDDTLFVLEHEPVVTLGRNAHAENVLLPADVLRARGIDVFPTGRGGDVTYHGPGQVVGYPIIALGDGERDVRRYVTCLEEIMIRAAHDFGVTADRVDGMHGVWVGGAKLGAV